MPGEFYQRGKAEKVDIKGILDRLDHAGYGLSALKALIDAVDALIDGVEAKLDDGTCGLAALKALIEAVDAVIDAVRSQTDKLAGGETKGIHQHQDSVLWQQVFEVTTATRKKVHAIWLDFANLTQNMEYRLSYRIDEANYRVFDANSASPWTPADDDGVLISGNFVISSDFKLELKSAVLEGAVRNIPYELDMEDME